ncbi:hypothetical protein [Photobacterium piscicola]|uniref:hypothetical protein n=1 Tax=Photobacterium piscicola TaxID=1378299 RepID=UPI003735DFF9
MPMTDADKKALQEKFNAEFLTMSNSLGGNPVALLRSEDAEKLITVAGRALEQMCEMAYAYHQPDDEQGDSITDTDNSDDLTQSDNPGATE